MPNYRSVRVITNIFLVVLFLRISLTSTWLQRIPICQTMLWERVLEEIDKGSNVSFLKRLSSRVYQWPKKVLIEPVEKDIKLFVFYTTLKLAKSG